LLLTLSGRALKEYCILAGAEGATAPDNLSGKRTAGKKQRWKELRHQNLNHRRGKPL
jgi:hypothetical protein